MKNLGEINATLPEGFEIVIISDKYGRDYSGAAWHGLQYDGNWLTDPALQDVRPLNWWRIRRYVKIARRVNGGVK